MDPLVLISLLSRLAGAICEQVRLVQSNPRSCERLYERVYLVVKTLQDLDKIPDSQNFKTALEQLHEWMKNCLVFVRQFTNETGFRRLLKAGMYRDKFDELNTGLGELIEALNLGISAQTLIDREQDKRDREEDLEDLKKGQGTLLDGQRKMLAGLQEQNLAQAGLKDIVEKQMASMQHRLDDLLLKRQPERPPIDEKLLIDYFCLEFNQEIARGGFGVVYRGIWSGQPVAVKMALHAMEDSTRQELIREIQIMSRLRSEYITQFYGACLEGGRECLIMEYLPGGSLYDALRSRRFNCEEIQSIALDLARGLNYLHHQGVVHRDLKSKNVLLDRAGKAKLADFGLSFTHASSVLSAGRVSQAIFWLAPEVLMRQPHTERSDIYSFGMILWELVSGKIPFAGFIEKDVPEKILSGEREKIPPDTTPEWKSLIARCWLQEPTDRPSLDEIIMTLEKYSPLKRTAEELYNEGLQAEKEKDFPRAKACYQKASEAGYVKALANLGYFCLKGPGGLPIDKQQACAFFRRGAEAGHVRSQVNLARMLEKGDGIEANLEESLHWYGLAAQSGDTTASSKLKSLLSHKS